MAPVLGVLFLALGCGGGPEICLTPEEVAAYDPMSPAAPLRILSINVWSGLTYDMGLSVKRYPDEPERRYAELVRRIRELEPDIVAIQEANPLPEYSERLAADLGYRAVSHVALGGIRLWSLGIPTNLREGGAVLVRKPWTIVDLGRCRLEGGGLVTDGVCFQLGELTQVLLVRVVAHGKPLYVYAVHLHAAPYRGLALDSVLDDLAAEVSDEDLLAAKGELDAGLRRRAREIAALKDFVARTLPPGMPAAIVGDFNTSPESGEFTPLLESGEWIDSFALRNPGEGGATWDPERCPNYREPSSPDSPYQELRTLFDRRKHRLDAILIRGNIPPERILESSVVLRPVDGFCPSDHYGVLTTLRW